MRAAQFKNICIQSVMAGYTMHGIKRRRKEDVRSLGKRRARVIYNYAVLKVVSDLMAA